MSTKVNGWTKGAYRCQSDLPRQISQYMNIIHYRGGFVAISLEKGPYHNIQNRRTGRPVLINDKRPKLLPMHYLAFELKTSNRY